MALQFINVPVVIKSMNFIHLTENWPICMHSDMASLCHLVNT